MKTKQKTPEPLMVPKSPKSLWSLLSGTYDKVGSYWAKKMKSTTEGFSKRTWMIILFFYLILGTSVCLYIIWSSL